MSFRSPKLRAAFFAIVVACSGLIALDAPSASAAPTTKTPVMGPSLLNEAQLAAWYARHSSGARLPSLGNNVRALAKIFIDEGAKDGVRGDIAFVQSMLETGWLRYEGSQIIPEAHNYSGIYAYNGRAKIVSCANDNAVDAAGGLPSRCFPSPNIGVRIQIQLLRSYADPRVRSMSGRLIKAPSDRAGMAPLWEYFGGHNCPCNKLIWASSDTYPIHILQLYSQALNESGKGGACVPYAPGASGTSGAGYYDVTSDRVVHTFGNAHFWGDARAKKLTAPLVGGESISTAGYWLLGRDGGIFTYGFAKYFGSTGGRKLNKPVNGMERTSNAGGYWLVADDGGIFAFGNAKYFGSTGDRHLNKPVLGMERTASGNGYWLFAQDGGLFTFGDAFFLGSLGGTKLKAPVVSMQRSPNGQGYWMLTLDGRVFHWGHAGFYGDVAACKNYGGALRLLPAPDGKGYWIATGNGAVIPFGSAKSFGFPTKVGGYTVALLGSD